MQRQHRFAFTPLQKAILLAGVLLCIWRFLQIPAVFDAIMKFCAAGEIPGTNAILSPDTTLWLVFSVCLTGALIIAFRLVFGSRHDNIVPRDFDLLPIAPPPASQPIVVIPPVVPQVRRRPNAVLLRLGGAMHGLRLCIGRRLHALLIGIRRLMAAATPYVAQAMSQVRRQVVRAFWLAVAFGLATWHWFEPYARRFDKWLAATLNSHRPTAIGVQIARELTRFIAEVRKLARQLSDRMQSHK